MLGLHIVTAPSTYHELIRKTNLLLHVTSLPDIDDEWNVFLPFRKMVVVWTIRLFCLHFPIQLYTYESFRFPVKKCAE